MGNCAIFNTRRNQNESSNETDSNATEIVKQNYKQTSNTSTSVGGTKGTPALVMERVDSSINTVWNLTKRQEDECEEIFSVFEEDDGE
jgi:hypothetical protein